MLLVLFDTKAILYVMKLTALKRCELLQNFEALTSVLCFACSTFVQLFLRFVSSYFSKCYIFFFSSHLQLRIFVVVKYMHHGDDLVEHRTR